LNGGISFDLMNGMGNRGLLLRWGGIFFFSAVAVYVMAYVDLIFRARAAYLEGEKYLEWNEHPELKKAYYDQVFARRKKRIEADFKSGRLTQSEETQKIELARFREKERLSESSLKYAYIWFQTAVKLFSPPESRWVQLSRKEMPKTLSLWKKELDARRIPYQDYMFE
jgi:hypothetical protein